MKKRLIGLVLFLIGLMPFFSIFWKTFNLGAIMATIIVIISWILLTIGVKKMIGLAEEKTIDFSKVNFWVLAIFFGFFIYISIPMQYPELREGSLFSIIVVPIFVVLVVGFLVALFRNFRLK